MSTFPQRQPPLSDALSVILPPPESTLFLRACLNSGQRGDQACRTWLKDHASNQTVLKQEPIKAFLPLFYCAAQTHGIEFRNGFSTILRTAALREELRTSTYQTICREVFFALIDHRVPSLVVGGAAFADVVYPNAALRHSHDIEILLNRGHLAFAVDLLHRLGFTLQNNSKTSALNNRYLRHNSGLPLVLRTGLFHNPFYNTLVPAFWTGSQTVKVAGVSIKTLCPADALLYLCGRASYPDGQESYHWIVDAWFTIHRNPEIDWNLLLEKANASHLVLPLFVMLEYLAIELNAQIPPQFLTQLSKTAFHATTIGRELALFGARSAVSGGFRNLLRRTQGWYARALIIKWMILPSPAYVRWIQQVHNLWSLPFCYLGRYVRYLFRYLWPQLRYQFRRKIIHVLT